MTDSTEPAVIPNPGEHRALAVLALLATCGIIYVAKPVGIGLFLGLLTSFTLQPLYRRLASRLRRPALAALICTLLVGLSAAGAAAGLGYVVIQRGVSMSTQLVRNLQPGGTLHNLAERSTRGLAALHIEPTMVVERLRSAAADLTSRLATLATTVAGLTASTLLGFFFLLLTTWYVLQNWDALTRRLELFLPLHPCHTRALLNEFRRVGRSVLLGTILTGGAQGVLAGLGYLITRVPEPAFFGVLTALASLLPAVGTLLVWVPLGVYLILTGHTALGVIELIWGGLVVVLVSDYVIRPALVGGHGEVPALLTFIALFGGVEVFGLIGLILGPVIMSLSIAVLRIYGQEAARQRSAL